jgi:predicted nucleic acid-binding protein
VSIFIDTSAFYAIIIDSDPNHASALQTWTNLVNRKESLITSNYAVLETIASCITDTDPRTYTRS